MTKKLADVGGSKQINQKEKTRFRATAKWKDFRAQLIYERGGRCEICGMKRKGLQAHHCNEAKYKDLNPANFVLLCPSCHRHVIERFIIRKEFDIEKTVEAILNIYKKTKAFKDLKKE